MSKLWLLFHLLYYFTFLDLWKTLFMLYLYYSIYSKVIYRVISIVSGIILIFVSPLQRNRWTDWLLFVENRVMKIYSLGSLQRVIPWHCYINLTCGNTANKLKIPYDLFKKGRNVGKTFDHRCCFFPGNKSMLLEHKPITVKVYGYCFIVWGSCWGIQNR